MISPAASHRVIGVLIPLAVWLFLWPATVKASTFHVTPIRIFLSPRIPSVLLTVRNDSTEKLRFQVGAFAWDQNLRGEMVLNPTDDIVVFPSLLSLGPGEERKLRVGTVAPFEVKEKSYRIFVEELPVFTKKEKNQVRILTRMGIPVFLQSAQQLIDGGIESLAIRRGQLSFQVTNRGNSHFVAKKLWVRGTGSEGEIFYQRELTGWYILADGSRRYEIDFSPGVCRNVRLITVEVETDEKLFKESLILAPGTCDE